MENAIIGLSFPIEFGWGIAMGALLLALGLAAGYGVGRRLSQETIQSRRHTEEMVSHLNQVMQYSRGLAEEMSQYGAVVTGVSQLFSASGPTLDVQQRDATVSLLSQVVEANERLKRRLSQAEGMLQDQAVEIATHMSEARTDPLTGLPNRRAFDEGLTRQMAEWRRHHIKLSVLTLDIDHFKQINDSYGHQVGDQVLLGIARKLKRAMRETDLICRVGGEELAVILPNSDVPEVCQAAEHARQAIEELRFSAGDHEFQVTTSIGAAACRPGESGSQMVNRADAALYAAKMAGRNRCFWHDGQDCLPVSSSRTAAAGRQLPIAESDPDRERDFGQVCEDLRRRLNEVITEHTR